MYKPFIKILSIITVISMLATGTVYPLNVSEYTLTPELRSSDHDFKRTFLATEICSYIERSGLAGSCEQIHENLSKIEIPNLTFNPSAVKGDHELYIVDPVDPDIIIRYFDPRKADLLTPYLELKKLETKVISPTLHRQILVLRENARPPLGQYDEMDSKYLHELIKFAREKVEKTELDPILPIAAMIVDRNGRVIVKSIRKDSYSSTKYGVRALHAEIAAVYEAQETGFDDWKHATMYVTVQSSYNCYAELKEEYGFERVVYGLPQRMSLEHKDDFTENGLAPKYSKPIFCKDDDVVRKIQGLISKEPLKSNSIVDMNKYTYKRAKESGVETEFLVPMEEYKNTFRDDLIAGWEFKSRYERMFEEEVDVIPIDINGHKNFWRVHDIPLDPGTDLIEALADLEQRDKEKDDEKSRKPKRRMVLLFGDYEASKDFRKTLIECEIVKPDQILIYAPDIFPSAVTKKPILDTHVHSKYSDGSLSPKEIMNIAKTMNLFALTISDHDNMEAYLDKEYDILKDAEKAGILLLPGSEISSLCHDDSIPQDSNEKVFADGYFLTDVIGVFPRRSNEDNKSFRNRLANINNEIVKFRNMFQKCVIFSLFTFMEDYPDAGLSMNKLLEKAQLYDIDHGFDVNMPEIDSSQEENIVYWKSRLRDPAFRNRLPKALFEFDVTLKYIVEQCGTDTLQKIFDHDEETSPKLSVAVSDNDILSCAKSILLHDEELRNEHNCVEARDDKGILTEVEIEFKDLSDSLKERARISILAKRLNTHILNNKDHYFGKPIRDLSKVLEKDHPESTGWGIHSTEHILDLIHKLHGHAILAHPEGQLMKMGKKRFEKWLEKLKRDHHLDGIEAFSRGQSAPMTLYLHSLAKRLGLKTTNGSDSHGSVIPGREIAIGYRDSKGNMTTIENIYDLATMEGGKERKKNMQNIMFSESDITEIFAAWSDLPSTKKLINPMQAASESSMQELLEIAPHSYFKAPMLRGNRYTEKIYEYQKRLSMAEYDHVPQGESLDEVINDIFGNDADEVRRAYDQNVKKFNRRIAKVILIQRMWDKFDVVRGTVSKEDFKIRVCKGDDDETEALWNDLHENRYLYKNRNIVLKTFWDLDGPDSMKLDKRFLDRKELIYEILSKSRYKYNPNTLMDHAERKWKAMIGFLEEKEDVLKSDNTMPVPRTDITEVLRLYNEYFGDEFRDLKDDNFSKHILIHLLLMHELGKCWVGEKLHEKKSENTAKLILDNDYFGFPEAKKKLLSRLVLIHHHIEYINDDNDAGKDAREKFRALISETAEDDYFSEKEMLNIIKMMTVFRIADRAQSEYFGFLFEPHFQHFKRMYDKASQMVRDMYYEKHHAPTPTVRRYISNSLEGCSFITSREKEPVLLRVPVETIENSEDEIVSDLLKTLQVSYNVYVRFYYASGLGEAGKHFYGRYHMTRKDLPDGFAPSRTNTISLMAADKGEDISDATLRARISGEVDMKPENTIIIPVGYQNDRMGLLLSTILGIKVLEISRHIIDNNINSPTEDQRLKDLVQKDVLELYQDLCPPEHRESMAGLTPVDIIELAHSGSINDILKTVKKLIKLLPILPLDIEDIRELYEHAKNTLVAA